jgi:hypothetical protein
MTTSRNLKHQEPLESALTAAISLIEDMDRHVHSTEGTFTVIPSVILWMMRQTSPELATNIIGLGQDDILASLLEPFVT